MLDENYPPAVVRLMDELLPKVRLVPIREFCPEVLGRDDWELLLALHRHRDRPDGLISNDTSMLELPMEMAVLHQTRLTLVLTAKAGDSPVRAVGMVVTHLKHIAEHSNRRRAQVWRLRYNHREQETSRHFLSEIARKNDTTIEALLRDNRVEL